MCPKKAGIIAVIFRTYNLVSQPMVGRNSQAWHGPEGCMAHTLKLERLKGENRRLNPPRNIHRVITKTLLVKEFLCYGLYG